MTDKTKEKKEKPKYVKICPNCGSLDILASNYSASAVAFGVPVPYRCKNCGFSSPIFPEVSLDELEEFKKNRKNKEGENGEQENDEKET